MPWLQVPADSNKASLQPSQAVAILIERVKRVGKVNNDIAEWLQVSLASTLLLAKTETVV